MNVDVYFCDLNKIVIENIGKASKRLCIAVAWISFDIYLQTFKNLIATGVKIEIICTNHPANIKQKDIIEELERLGVKITLLTMPRGSNFMHHKFAIIDNTTIISGSFNWTKNAEYSFENLLVINSNLELAAKYLNEFDRLASLNRHIIRSLQFTSKCKRVPCSGKLINLLVICGPLENTNEMWGDLLEVCTDCLDYRTLHRSYQDATLFSKLVYESPSDDDIESINNYNFNYQRDLDSHLLRIRCAGKLIHAIGLIGYESCGKDGDGNWVTKILWKNRFIDKEIQDVLYDTFDVNYE